MAEKRDYYEVLGVSRDADAKTIKRAFLKLAKTLHPDVSDDPNAEEKFKEVNEAYSVLSDETKRSNYDRYGTPDGPGGFGSDFVDMSDIFGGGFGMGDIFDSFFGGFRGQGHGQPAQRTRGRDMSITITISLAEAAAGCKKTIAYDRLGPCDDCEGSGVAEGGNKVTCEKCHGTGVVETVRRTMLGTMRTSSPCPDCGGIGMKVDKPCETCGGQGRTPTRERVELEIPAGVLSGQSIRVPGKGEAGVLGDEAGDLIAQIYVERDERFERQNNDLGTTVEVDAFQAMLGATVELDGILADEKIDVEVPAGCQYGQSVVISGHGMPRQGGQGRGDLFVVIRVVTPEDLTDEQKATLEAILAERKAAAGATGEAAADDAAEDATEGADGDGAAE